MRTLLFCFQAAFVGCAVCIGACASPARPPPSDVAPAISIPKLEPTKEAEVAPPPVVDAGAPVDPCRGTSFYVDALPKSCQTQDRSKGQAVSLPAEMTLDASSVKPGAEVGVTVTFTNDKAEDVELTIRPGCARFGVQAFQGNKRADFVNASCGFGTGCGGHAYRIVLAPGGTLTAQARYKATVERMSKKCESSYAPLPPGKYELRVEPPSFSGLPPTLATVRAPLVVTR